MSDYDPDEILNDPFAHPLHKQYAAINVGIRDRGEHWRKCLNCGDPFQFCGGGGAMFCSDSCENEFSDDMM